MSKTSPVPAGKATAETAHSQLLVQRLAKHLKCASGYCVDYDKLYLIENKLRPIMRAEGMSSLAALVAAVEQDRSSRLADAVAQAMTINETHFFRDRTPFDALRSALTAMARGRPEDRFLRIWSAASSTGQELYSIAMVIEELGPLLGGWRIELVGTDLSEAVVQKAANGRYSQFEVQRGLPAPLLIKYFDKQGEEWVIKQRVRDRVRFKRHNLLHDFASLGRFNFVFCRNVLFYFEPETRNQILKRIAQSLSPDGCLVLGSSEALTGLAAGYRVSSLGSGFMCWGPEKPAQPLHSPAAVAATNAK